MLHFSSVCIISLVLTAALRVASMPLQHLTQEKTIKLEQQYLTDVYKSMQDSGRQPNSDGDINLLPDENGNFANIVHTLTEDQSSVSQDINSKHREISFNLKHNFMSSTQEIVDFHLVFPVEEFSTAFTVNVYDPENLVKPMDSQSTAGKYIDLHVTKMDQPNLYPKEIDMMYNLVIEVTDVGEDSKPEEILSQLVPMLVVYSYDDNMWASLFQSPDEKETARRRRDTADSAEAVAAGELRKKSFCQIHNITLTSFPSPAGDNLEILYPEVLKFSFCDGHCKIDAEKTNGDKVSRNGQYIGRMNPELIDNGVARCCIPTSYSMSRVDLCRKSDNTSVVIMAPMEQVTSCRCY